MFHRYEPKRFNQVRTKPLSDGTKYHSNYGYDDQGGYIKDFRGSMNKT